MRKATGSEADVFDQMMYISNIFGREKMQKYFFFFMSVDKSLKSQLYKIQVSGIIGS